MKQAKELLYGPRPQGFGCQNQVRRGMTILALNGEPIDLETDLINCLAQLACLFEEEIGADDSDIESLFHSANALALGVELEKPSAQALIRPLGVHPLGVHHPPPVNALAHARAYIEHTTDPDLDYDVRIETALSYLFAVAWTADPCRDANDLIRDAFRYWQDNYRRA